MKNTVFVLGAPGFIGRQVARVFHGAGFRVIGLGIEAPENAPLQYLSAYHSLSLPEGRNEFIGLVRKYTPWACVHCAGRASVPYSLTEPAVDFQTSVDLTFEVLNALRLYSHGTRLLFLSSAAVYGNPDALPMAEDVPLKPISPYGFHKRICEELCLEFNTVYEVPTASVRIFSAYGQGLRRQVVYDLCCRMLRHGSVVLQGTGGESRDFIHVADVSRGLRLLCDEAAFEGEVYNLASGRETRISELAECLREEIDPSIHLEYDGIIPKGTPQNWQADISRISALGFVPQVDLVQGVHHLVRWCKADLQEG